MGKFDYWAYWRRGWLVLAFMIVVNVGLGVTYGIVAKGLSGFFDNPMPWAAGLVWLVVGAPACGLLFEKLAGVSKRIMLRNE